ncbi:MAG: exopolysaccharide biosynthesis protein [Alphaproteobacteria bacterium]
MSQNDKTEFDGLEDIAETVLETADGDAETVEDLRDAVGRRSFGPFLVVIGTVGALPLIGDIPGMTILIGMISMLIGLQMLIMRDRIWLPNSLLERHLPADKLQSSIDKALPWLKRVDAVVEPRIKPLTGKGGTWISGIALLIAGLACIPLEFVPFAGTVPCLGIAFLGLSLAIRDGVLWLAAMLLIIATTALTGWIIHAEKLPFMG